MRPPVLIAMIQVGVAGFFWGAVLYELLGKTTGHPGTAVFCACALSIAAYFATRRL